MMRYLLVLSLLLFTFSCSNSGIKLSKGEEIFLSKMLEKNNQFRSGNHLVFILNQSFCAPCEEEVKKFYSQKFTNCTKTFVISSNRKPTADEAKKSISFEYKKLASYGLIRANGTVLILKNGNCVLLESIDIPSINSLTTSIKSRLK